MIIDTTKTAQPTQRKLLDYDMLRILKINKGTTLLTKYRVNPGFEGSWHITLAKDGFYEERYPFSSEFKARTAALQVAKKI